MEEIINIEQKRHSLSHIMAQAVQRYKGIDTKLGIGPCIENGFYYDFLFEDKQLIEEDLKEIQNAMEKIIKEGQDFIKFTLDIDECDQILKMLLRQPYKIELKNDFKANGENLISFYINIIDEKAVENALKGVDENYLDFYRGVTQYFRDMIPQLDGKFVTFVDMCEGPHINNTKEIQIGSFKIEKIAGAYWKGDEKNIMMTRIYAFAFDTKDQLKAHLEMLEEAKKRDHRILGEKLKLFMFSENVGLGLPMWLPKGGMLWKQVEDFWKFAHEKHGYEFVRSPHIGNKVLWETSGHRGFYADGMYPPMEVGQSLEDAQKGIKAKEPETFLLKPMNCPFHVELYKAYPKSYREFPMRWCETGTVYRFEKKGQLSGLTRVRGFTQDDAHIFCRKDQVESELKRVVDFILYIFENFGFDKNSVHVFLSLRDPNNKEKYAGNDEGWDLTQLVLEKVAIDMGLNYTKEEGEAAFYGPKLDFKVKDVLGRLWQCSTLQFDFNLPERFDMTFTNQSGDQERPYMLHRALFGSFERFLGILIEHYAGAFPLWLAPEQIRIIPVVDKFVEHADKIYENMKNNGLRVNIDDSDNSLNKKIRNAELEKVPYIVVIGEKEIADGTLSIREYKTKAQYEIKVDDFIAKCEKLIQDRINE